MTDTTIEEAKAALRAQARKQRATFLHGYRSDAAKAAAEHFFAGVARQPGEVRLIVNEVTAESRAGLVDGFVTMAIATPLPQLCDDLVRMMAEAARSGPSDVAGQHFLRPELVLPESV